MSGGGSSAPTQSTVTQTNIPDYAQPYVESALGQAAALTNINQNPYQPYQGQQVAGFTPMQTQAMQNIGNQQVAPQLTDASNMAYMTGQYGLGTQDAASQLQNASLGYGAQGNQVAQQNAGLIGAYGSQAQQAGQTGQDLGVQGGGGYGALGAGYGAMGAGLAGQNIDVGQAGMMSGLRYGVNAQNQNAVQNYMNPYLQSALQPALQEVQRQYDITGTQEMGNATKAGAFGGNREALMAAENQRNKNMAMNQLIGQGYNQAYNTANQNMQAASQLGMQGANVGLAGLNAANQNYLAGIQGAQAGLQGVNAQLAGTAQGMQGSQIGMQGATQAGQLGVSGANTGLQSVQGAVGAGQYGLQGLNTAGQAASTLGALGQTQFGQEQAANQAMLNAGAQQQQLQQQGLNIGIQDYQNQLNYPYRQLGFMSDLLRGLPLTQQSQSIYQSAPPASQQLMGLGLGAAGLSKAFG